MREHFTGALRPRKSQALTLITCFPQFPTNTVTTVKAWPKFAISEIAMTIYPNTLKPDAKMHGRKQSSIFPLKIYITRGNWAKITVLSCLEQVRGTFLKTVTWETPTSRMTNRTARLKPNSNPKIANGLSSLGPGGFFQLDVFPSKASVRRSLQQAIQAAGQAILF